jgi:hypothetical protein
MRSVHGILGAVLGAVALTLAGLLLAVGSTTSGSGTHQVAWAQASSCGNGVVEAGEECEPPGSQDGCNVGELCQNDCSCGSAGGALDHFQCYEIRPPYSLGDRVVSLVDQFGSSTATVKKAKSVCAPANKNGEDAGAVNHPMHLVNYQIKPAAKFARQSNLQLSNQFGSIRVDAVKAARLLVPSTKSLTGNPPSPAPGIVDHFQCYKAKRSKGTAKFGKVTGVSVQTQFESISIDLVKPLRVCVPVDKNGEGITDDASRLLCYRIKSKGGFPATVYVNNQFGPQTYSIAQRREFCVPSTQGTYGSPSRAFLDWTANLLD